MIFRFISKLNVLFTLYFALIKCDLEVMYGVYVVEQDGNTPFNRAMLMNVGAAEAVKQQVFITLPMFSISWNCSGLPVLHIPRRGSLARGRQEPVHLSDTTEAHVRVHRQLPLSASL